jgi:hypothetical protein
VVDGEWLMVADAWFQVGVEWLGVDGECLTVGAANQLAVVSGTFCNVSLFM